MGLIDLKTDLKSLRYGKDTLGGGYSGQPYIQKAIPEGFSTLGADEDFLLRGGINVVSDTKDDILRLGKMFTSLKSPNGLLFIAKQQLLSRTAVRTQTSGILNEGIYSPLNTLAQAGVSALGGHLNKQGINPFAQTGAYANNDSLYSVKINHSQDPKENRLVLLKQAIDQSTPKLLHGMTLNSLGNTNVLSYGGGPNSNLGIGKTNIRYASSEQRTGKKNKYFGTDFFTGKNSIGNKKLINGKQWFNLARLSSVQSWNSSSVSQAYEKSNNEQLGFPSNEGTRVYSGSVGVDGKLFNLNAIGSQTWTANQDLPKYEASGSKGATEEYIKAFPDSKYTFQNSLDNNSVYNAGATFPDGTNSHNFDQGTITYNQTMLFNSEANTGIIQDFRKVIRDTLGNTEQIKKGRQTGTLTDAPDYSTKNTDVRNQQGNPGNRAGKNYSNYTTGVVDVATGKTQILDQINASAIGSPVGDWNDLVTFNIVPISGVGAMTFRAFLGSISDSFTGNISAHKFAGRGENFYTYDGFDRKFSLSWTTAAQSKGELIPMYQKLSFLASNLAPIYNNGYMQGPLVKLSIGGYFRDMPGYITGLNYELTEESSWDIQINEKGGIDRTTSELPFIIKVSGFSFVPIPTYLPQQGAPMIDIWNGNSFSLAYNTHGASNMGRKYGTTARGLESRNAFGKVLPNTINGGYDKNVFDLNETSL